MSKFEPVALGSWTMIYDGEAVTEEMGCETENDNITIQGGALCLCTQQ